MYQICIGSASVLYRCYIEFISASYRLHIDSVPALYRPFSSSVSDLYQPYIGPISALYPLRIGSISDTSAPYRTYRRYIGPASARWLRVGSAVIFNGDIEVENAGVAPDVLVHNTPADCAEGRDSQLDAALREVNTHSCSTEWGYAQRAGFGPGLCSTDRVYA